MIIAIDTETHGLNAQHFLMGAIVKERGDTETYRDKKKMYNRLIELAFHEQKNNRRLTIYAHNMMYDYMAIGAHEDERNLIFCTRPFIADTLLWHDNGESTNLIKWVDTMGLRRGPLTGLAESIGMEKGYTPDFLKNEHSTYTEEDLDNAERYMIHDATIVLNFVLQLRIHLWKRGIRPRTLLTAGQVSMSALLKHIHDTVPTTGTRYKNGWKLEQNHWFENKRMRQFWKSKWPHNIHEAYRSGRCELFQPGQHDNVTSIDLNSLYPYTISTMPLPIITTEWKTLNPLDTMTQDDVLQQYGISRCLIKTPEQIDIPYLPIRIKNEDGEEISVYPGPGHVLYGSWTHKELRRALTLGYTIHAIDWTIAWKTHNTNILHDYFAPLYTQRQKQTGFNAYFTKMLMNTVIGKFAQRRPKTQTKYIPLELLPEHQQRDWNAIGSYANGYLIQRDLGPDQKRHSCPVLAVMTNAYARDNLYTSLQQLPHTAIIYCDTDSIFYHHTLSHMQNFKYGTAWGQWKKVTVDQPFHGLGKKAYKHGDTMHVSRIPTSSLTPENFSTGIFPYTEILTPITAPSPEQIGRPEPRIRDVNSATSVTTLQEFCLVDTTVDLPGNHLTTITRLAEEHHGISQST